MTKKQLVDAITGVSTGIREPNNQRTLTVDGLVTAAMVMYGRGQSSIAYSIIVAAHAVMEVPLNIGLRDEPGDYLGRITV